MAKTKLATKSHVIVNIADREAPSCTFSGAGANLVLVKLVTLLTFKKFASKNFLLKF